MASFQLVGIARYSSLVAPRPAPNVSHSTGRSTTVSRIMKKSKITQELEATLGGQVRALRLRENLDQRALAERAGVGLSALKNVESGKGATLKTFIKVLRALGRVDWLETLAPAVSISPLQMLKTKPVRQRASRVRKPVKQRKNV